MLAVAEVSATDEVAAAVDLAEAAGGVLEMDVAACSAEVVVVVGRQAAWMIVCYPASSLAAFADDAEVLAAGMEVDMLLQEVEHGVAHPAVFAIGRRPGDCRTVGLVYTRSLAAALGLAGAVGRVGQDSSSSGAYGLGVDLASTQAVIEDGPVAVETDRAGTGA